MELAVILGSRLTFALVSVSYLLPVESLQPLVTTHGRCKIDKLNDKMW